MRGALLLEGGELMWPPPRAPATPAPSPSQVPIVAAPPETPEELAARAERQAHDEAAATAMRICLLGAALLAVGAASPDVRLTEELTTLSLAGLVGYNLVWGVSHSLHSPLMSVTNAVSGMTAVGGLLLMGGGLVPSNTTEALAAASVGLSCVNIAGGFVMTDRMLGMFRRKVRTSLPSFLLVESSLVPSRDLGVAVGLVESGAKLSEKGGGERFVEEQKPCRHLTGELHCSPQLPV